MVQAILNKDLKKIQKLSVNPKTKLMVEVKHDSNYKIRTKCNYIGLVYHVLNKTMLCNFLVSYGKPKITKKMKTLVQKEADHLYCVINLLSKKRVATKNIFVLTPYFKHKGKWKIAKGILGEEVSDNNWVKSFIKDYKNNRLF